MELFTLHNLAIIGVLVFLESLLSLDNALSSLRSWREVFFPSREKKS